MLLKVSTMVPEPDVAITLLLCEFPREMQRELLPLNLEEAKSPKNNLGDSSLVNTWFIKGDLQSNGQLAAAALLKTPPPLR